MEFLEAVLALLDAQIDAAFRAPEHGPLRASLHLAGVDISFFLQQLKGVLAKHLHEVVHSEPALLHTLGLDHVVRHDLGLHVPICPLPLFSLLPRPLAGLTFVSKNIFMFLCTVEKSLEVEQKLYLSVQYKELSE